MADVNPADVDALAADGGDTALTVPIITAMVQAYTRGQGFDGYGEPNEELAAVIATAAARLIGNPKQVSMARTAGPFTVDVRSRGFEGWTLAELAVLNCYRKRAW
jgi:hypothetical protein